MEAGREILSLYFPEEGAQNADLRAYVEEWKIFLSQHRRTLLKHVRPSTLEVFLSYRELLARNPPPSAEACAAALRASPQDVLDAIACGTHLAVLAEREESTTLMGDAIPPAETGTGATLFEATLGNGDGILVGGSEADSAGNPNPRLTRHTGATRIWIRLLGFGPLTVSFPGPCTTARCSSRHFLPQRREAETVDWQKFCLQAEDARAVAARREENGDGASAALASGEGRQPPEGDSRSSAGEKEGSEKEKGHEEKSTNEVRRPPSVDCEVRGSLVNSCRLGEKVVVVGVVRAYQTACLSLCGGGPVPEAARARAPGPGRSLYSLYLDVVSVASANPEHQKNVMQRVQRTQQAIYAGFPHSLHSLCLDGPLAELSVDEIPWRDFTSQEGHARGKAARGRLDRAAGSRDWQQKTAKTELTPREKRDRQTPPRSDTPQTQSARCTYTLAGENVGCTYTSDRGEASSASPAKSALLEDAYPAYPGDPDFEELDSRVAMQHLEFITEIFEEEDRLELLAASLAPHIRGHEIPKAALVLTLLGGVAVYGDSGESGDTLGEFDSNSALQSFEGRTLKRRGSIHLLLLGDAGVGKSRLLRAAAEVGSGANAPLSASLLRSLGLAACKARRAFDERRGRARGCEPEDEDEDLGPGGSVFVCGNTTSAAGLTASTHREQGTGEFALEAGALVLADGGICCVDELDKMHAASTSADVSALLEAMEHQTVSVVKGSCYCTLPARTAIAAAANPKDGRFIPSKSLSENMKMPHCLTSRFDLILCLHDDGAREGEACLSKRRRTGEAGEGEAPGWTNASNDTAPGGIVREGKKGLSLAERIGNVKPSKWLPLSLVQTYLAYARQYVHPVMTTEAGQALKRLFSFLRKQKENEFSAHDSLPVGMRQLESLIRLCEARARADLVEEVTEDHVRDVGEIFVHSAAFSRLAFAASPVAQAEAARLCLHPPGHEHLNGTSATVAAQLVGIAAGKRGRKRKSLAGLVPSFLRACCLFVTNNQTPGLTQKQLLECASVVVARGDSTVCPEALVACANESGYILRKADGLWQVDHACLSTF
ncbi:putative DNA replication licensing factor [Neospora caninum Liverpool]|uniref:DNA helicase n=1 Tax=Neospora caninum (strain Liverpool) TaxID=572307 RepID=F0VNW0_NEOCL|nr:putative DNA replication licensing factor [Neospora caninum Liverpool]CBZ55406.1 putative DNA replication licensing factor [Neospora caninum Liverpool]|eukprot:XP_003885434.1 putative DNA replication licensing factor [Neospora caninum Liverpool]